MTTPDVILDGNREIARYNRRLLWLAAFSVAVCLALLAATLVKVVSLAEDAQASAVEAAEQTAAIREVLARQARNDADRARIIDEAVAKLTAEQDEALAFHDASVKQYLESALGLLDIEVNLPANKERQAAVVAPAPAVAPAPSDPTPLSTAPAPVPAPAPAPAPAPPPCQKAGKSDRCKR